MNNRGRSLGMPEWLILIGGCVFILVLALSAYFEADIRWLHFFQGCMYVAIILLSLRANRWGYFIGISAAGLWDYINLFVTTFLANGFQELTRWAQNGHLARPDLLIAIPAWFSNFLLLVGCLWAYFRLTDKRRIDFVYLLIAFALATGYLAADMALFQPRYLALFPRMFHPHQPW